MPMRKNTLQVTYRQVFGALGNFRGESIPISYCGEDLEAAEERMNESTPEEPEHAVLRAQMRRLLEAKIDRLPDAVRTVFVLRAVEELSVEETAAALDMPEATARTWFRRARGQLREALRKEIDLALHDAFAFDGSRCDRIVAAVTAKIEDAAGSAGS
jgi:RNA polymerase sigma-70 factor (ECF subfamily)